ncbi:MAG: STAS domain-containing protein [Candidatus Delongbacteria bacterium]|nr:STAS domain-containing protein [Candidatus Delongbacteria bacterium]
MVLTSSKNGNVVIVEVHEDINFENTRELKTYVRQMIDKEQSVNFIINLKPVSFIDSSGLGTLVSLLALLRKVNGQMKLVGINQTMDELFKLTRLDAFFEIYSNTQDALDSFL